MMARKIPTKPIPKAELQDIRQAYPLPLSALSLSPKTDAQPLSPSVGAMAAAVLAAAGATLCDPAGRVTCETDYLAISGATFPKDVTREEMEEFNRETLREVMDEAAEQARYAAIAGFWRRRNA